MGECPFCDRIAAGEYETFAADAEFPSVVWFCPLRQVTQGHMLFVPARHVADALEDPYTTALTMEYASRWRARKWGLAGDGAPDCNLITSVGAAATQSVRHLHVHLIPRRPGDGLHLPWTGQAR